MTHRRIRIAAVSLVALMLALMLVGIPLGLLAIRQGMIAPPAFALRLGELELAAPCPPRMASQCGRGLPYYAVWRGERQADGSTTYHLIYFTYLPRPERR